MILHFDVILFLKTFVKETLLLLGPNYIMPSHNNLSLNVTFKNLKNLIVTEIRQSFFDVGCIKDKFSWYMLAQFINSIATVYSLFGQTLLGQPLFGQSLFDADV